jgi:hypothetical protein
MSDRRSSSDLGSSAEATLSAFPIPERDWESDARAIEARLGDGVRGSTDAALLAAPLPCEAGEPSSSSATATPLTNSGVRTQSLAELARRSVEKKQASERQIARESLALAAQQRQRGPQVDAAPALGSVRQVSGSPVAAVSRARDNAPVASNRFPAVALALPALALAAAALFWFSHPETAPLVTSGPAAAPPSAVTPEVGRPGAVGPGAVAEQRPPLDRGAPSGIDPSTLPGEATQATDAAQAKVLLPSKSGASKPALKDGHAAPVAESPDKSLPPDPGLRPADSRGSDLPAKPSSGAVQVALGAVLGGARHCVAGDDAPSSAVVVFGSDGRVQQVTVSGAAAGKSSATCIEAQLSRARVQPFAASSFSVNATVRPE